MVKPTSLCPFCGAYSTRSCELEDETGGNCPWELVDDMRDDRIERERLNEEYDDD